MPNRLNWRILATPPSPEKGEIRPGLVQTGKEFLFHLCPGSAPHQELLNGPRRPHKTNCGDGQYQGESVLMGPGRYGTRAVP
jgi:hypothetical protein